MTATCHRRQPSEYPELLQAEAERLIEVVYGAPEDLDIPSCPGWSARQIGEHVGGLYRWAEAHVRTGAQARIRDTDLDLQMPPEFDAHPQWIRRGLEMLTSSLEANDPDKPLWAWGSDKRARFWGPRMLYETTIHRADVELARGREPVVDADTAVDGIDEFLDNLPHASHFAPGVDNLRADNRTLGLHATDAGVEWRIRLLPDRFEWDHDVVAEPDANVSGPPGNLLLFTYGRRAADQMETTGDADVVDLWLTDSSI